MKRITLAILVLAISCMRTVYVETSALTGDATASDCSGVHVDAAVDAAPDAVVHHTCIAVWGQSNAEGKGPASAFTDQTLVQPYAPVNYVAENLASAATTAPAWETYSGPVAPYVYDGTVPLAGVELTLARALNPVEIEKTAIGGASLAAIWCASASICSYPRDTEDYARLAIDHFASVVTAGNCDREVVVWMQGERDAQSSTYSAAYQSNLGGLVALERARFPGTIWIIGRISINLPLSSYPYRDAIRAAETAYVASDPLSALVDQDAAPLQAGNLHYTSDGYASIGQLDATAIGGFFP